MVVLSAAAAAAAAFGSDGSLGNTSLAQLGCFLELSAAICISLPRALAGVRLVNSVGHHHS